jgi:hypothetical protein
VRRSVADDSQANRELLDPTDVRRHGGINSPRSIVVAAC